MKIYVGHSSDSSFREELYSPLRESELTERHDLVFPHEDSDELFDSKEFLETEADLFLAEVSEASTGLGIELGWAEQFKVPILCIYKKGSNPSGSLNAVTDNIKEYRGSEALIGVVKEAIRELDQD